jgi:hypothetical protein
LAQNYVGKTHRRKSATQGFSPHQFDYILYAKIFKVEFQVEAKARRAMITAQAAEAIAEHQLFTASILPRNGELHELVQRGVADSHFKRLL